MTPDELRAIATVMRDLGVFRVKLPDHIEIELSQHAIQAGQAEALARTEPKTEPAPAPEAEAPAEPPAEIDFAATEGFPE